ncbi:protein of unknown function [Kosakonia oryzendophytica]|uniref:SiaC family regulatory phosphoprotein domain-containing protein n=1 Tax=Kosakonia oryzendophytica TaxID=1005665 RepID=A0A1C3ZA62_9ENTR|nr:DUF1987 domain-containing protein [Kosakonia oryzendophytica]AMO47877.1 lipoprotein [Enterobacter sp. FY-07]TDT58650.1 uncharacterized protein DUF1987 [Enterobacter sp. AG5470]WBT59561.1 DUF1987 domain-containing protein [Kosakonia oryzendophytica]SCB79153.1 protein of unknown function [Kosakonia oryzendophytica]
MTDTTLTPPIELTATAATPEVKFDFAAQRLLLKGEAYPENAAAFFRPLLDATESWLQTRPQTSTPVQLHVALRYFNSSSTKLLFTLFESLNDHAKQDVPCELHWYYDAEDDISEEFGQELRVDFPSLAVFLIPDINAC